LGTYPAKKESRPVLASSFEIGIIESLAERKKNSRKKGIGYGELNAFGGRTRGGKK